MNRSDKLFTIYSTIAFVVVWAMVLLFTGCGQEQSDEVAEKRITIELEQPDYETPTTDTTDDAIVDPDPLVADDDDDTEPDCVYGVWYDEKADPNCLRCEWEEVTDVMDMCNYNSHTKPRLENEPTEITETSTTITYHYQCIWNADHTDLFSYHEPYENINGNIGNFLGGYTSGAECE